MSKLTPVEQAMRLQIIGAAAEAGVTERMQHWHAKLQLIQQEATEKGQDELATFFLALGLFNLEIDKDI